MKELIKHGIVYGVTSSLQNLLAFLLLPLLTVYYTPAEFGIYSIILLSGTLANSIFYLGAGSALGRYYYEEDSDAYRKNIITTTILITGFGAALLIILAFIFSENLSLYLFNDSAYSKHLLFAFAGTAFSFLLNILTLVLRYDKKSILFLVVTVTGVCINFIVTYVLLKQYHYGIMAPILGTLFSNLASFGFLFIYYFNKLVGSVHISNIKLLLFFGLQSSITGILYFLLDWVDRLIIKNLLPMSDVGVYSLGYRIGSMINVLLIVPFSLVWAPLRMQYAKNENNRLFVQQITSYFIMLGMIFVFLATLFSDVFMNIFFSNKDFSGADMVFPITMLATLTFGLQNIVDFGIYYHKKLYYYIIISAIGLIFNVTMNYLFIPKFGYISAAYVTLFTYLLTTCLIYIASNRYYKIEFDWKRIVIPLLIVLLGYFSVHNTNLFYEYGVGKKLVVLILTLMLIIKYWLRVPEKDKLIGLFKKLFS